ncbi:hypothetical protein F5B22DRAFT_593427 [Xylaria bambusicola]|uniref:uncharacterized protein n=1 Tax=Xylaria bambusicola TaxID=326684 RepID=UPI002007BEC2|nr:uncharacterized protein F5B22DRAFT_593427 [Xylaria bambusicola]KAI0522230.1 hypothetical protein F5B22DRAFT_593427 [Xylaria bambusicola]
MQMRSLHRGCCPITQVGAASKVVISAEAKDKLMQSHGSLDVGCSIFDYSIVETTLLELQERQCYDADEFGSHGDIHGYQLDQITIGVCTGLDDAKIKRGDPSTNIAIRNDVNGQPVQLGIYWKDNGVLDYLRSMRVFRWGGNSKETLETHIVKSRLRIVGANATREAPGDLSRLV